MSAADAKISASTRKKIQVRLRIVKLDFNVSVLGKDASWPAASLSVPVNETNVGHAENKPSKKNFEVIKIAQKMSTVVQDDPRIGDLLLKGYSVEDAQVVVVPFPHEEGVKRNGGRPGASGGPQSFLGHIQRTGALRNDEFGVDISGLRVAVAPPVAADVKEELEVAHAELRKTVAGLLRKGQVPFVVGGGNDQSHPNGGALLDVLSEKKAAGRRPCVVNIDAHLDVRPRKLGKVHSGTPFRELLLEEQWETIKGEFAEFAAQGMQCSAQHAQWLRERPRTDILWLKNVRAHAGGPVEAFKALLERFGEDAAVFVSFDLDAVRGADAPGVSCPGAQGLTSEEALGICFAAGACPNVALFDLSEYSPEIEGYRTGKLVAAMFYYFLMGYSTRK